MRLFITKVTVLILIAIMVIPIGISFAQEDDNSSTNQSDRAVSQLEESEETEADEDDTKAVKPKSELRNKREERRAELDQARVQRALNSCEKLQNRLAQVSDNVSNGIESRQVAFRKVESKLLEIVDRLNANSVNTETLTKLANRFGTRAEAILTQVDEFKVTIDEVVELECNEANIETVLLAVDEAKGYRGEISSGVNALKKLLDEDIIDELDVIKTYRLPNDDESGTESEEQ